MATVGSLEADIAVNTANMDKRLQDIFNLLNKARTAFENTTQATTKASAAHKDVAASIDKVTKSQSAMVGESANLGRALRVLTTSLFGVNLVTITVGTALGNLATQMASQLVIAVKNAIEQFADLHNQLLLIPNIAGKAASSVQLITDTAQATGTSIQALSQRYIQLANAASGTGISIEQVNRVFRQQEELLAIIRQDTLGETITKLLDGVGKFVLALDKMFNISGIVITSLNILADTINLIASGLDKLSGAADERQRMQELRAKGAFQLLEDSFKLEKQIQLIEQENKTNTLGGLGQLFGTAKVDATELRKELDRIKLILAEMDFQEGQQGLKILGIHQNIEKELGLRIGIARDLRREQEIRLRQFQLENQFLATGLTHQEARLEAEKQFGLIRQAFAAEEIQSIRASMLDPVTAELENYAQRTQALKDFYGARQDLTGEFNQLLEAEMARSSYVLQKIEFDRQRTYLTAFTETGRLAQTLLEEMGQKSKLAAAAAVIVGKGLAIATTIQQGIAASMAAIAPPPIGLGPTPAGFALAGTIKALTAVNVGLIAATGVLQTSAALNNGSGGGAPAPPPAITPPDSIGPQNPAGPTRRIVIEPVDPAMIFTGSQLNDLIDLINEKASNGKVVIANKVIKQR